MDKSKKRKWIGIVAALAIALAATLLIWRGCAGGAAGAGDAAGLVPYETYSVARGTLEKTITATGALVCADTDVMNLPDGILVDDVLVKTGDVVAKGDTLALLNAASVNEQLAYLAKKVKEEDNKLATAGSEESITAPAKGRVKYQPVAEGDDVLAAMETYGALAILSTDGWMRLEIETERELTLGQRMEVVWDGGGVSGTVDRRTATGYVVLVPDGRAPYLGKATLLDVDGTTEIGSGTLTINMPVEVYGFDGTIRTIRYHLDESVPDGREMFELKNAPVSIAFSARFAARSKLAELYKQVIELSEHYRVTAPCDGVVGEISIKKGQATGKTANADARAVAFQFNTGGATTLAVNVDELDITLVTAGQTASISLDALPSETLTAEVTRVTRTGKKENSIATFPVELTLPLDERFMAGMNATATILVERAEDVLLIPIMAIEEDAEGAFVYVLGTDGTRVRTAIQTGRSDGQMAEVLEGLQEGDTLSYVYMDMSSAGGATGSVTVAGA